MATPRRGADSNLAARELGFLVRLAQAAASTQKPDELLDLIIGEATSAMGTDVCSLYLVTSPGRELLLTATNGLNVMMVGKVVMRVGEGITGWVAETRRPAVVPDVSKEPHWKWVPGLDEDRFQSMLSVPIESGPRLVGVLAGGKDALYSSDGYRVRGVGVSSDGLPARIHVPVPLAQAGAREVRINAGRPARALDVVPVRAGADLLGLLAVAVDEQTVD